MVPFFFWQISPFYPRPKKKDGSHRVWCTLAVCLPVSTAASCLHRSHPGILRAAGKDFFPTSFLTVTLHVVSKARGTVSLLYPFHLLALSYIKWHIKTVYILRYTSLCLYILCLQLCTPGKAENLGFRRKKLIQGWLKGRNRELVILETGFGGLLVCWVGGVVGGADNVPWRIVMLGGAMSRYCQVWRGQVSSGF